MDKTLVGHYLELAAEEGALGVALNEGGPFGTVIVYKGEVIARGHNKVISSKNPDPTAHSEIVAIREAAKYLNTYDLSGCVLFASCEPCPMCFAAIHWARIDCVYYGATREDAAAIGFDDKCIYDMLSGSAETLVPKMFYVDTPHCKKIIESYGARPSAVIY